MANGIRTISLGVDCGHRYTKLHDDCGKTSVRDTKLRLGQNTSISLSGGDTGVVELVDGKGQTYSVGKITKHDRISPESFAKSAMNPIMAHYSIYEHFKSETKNTFDLEKILGSQFRICAGIPFGSYYLPNGQRNEEMINSVLENLSQEITIKTNEFGDVRLDTVFVLKPQTAIGYFDHILDEQRIEGSEPWRRKAQPKIDNINDSLALIDIGGGTSDIVVFNEHRNIEMPYSGSERVGGNTAEHFIKEAIISKFSLDDLKPKEIERAMKTGKVKIANTPYDVRSTVDDAYDELASQILGFIHSKIGSGKDLDVVRVFGGAVKNKALADRLKDRIRAPINIAGKQQSTEEWSNEAQFINARALYLCARYKESTWPSQ